MPPRKQKQPDAPVQETPVIFFLKVPENMKEDVLPADATTTYSEILNAVEVSKVGERFNNDLLKPILEKMNRDSVYSPHTACFWCCHTFGWGAFSVPISYDAHHNIYSCEGHFCSPECGLAYVYGDVHISDSTRWNRHAMMNFMYSTLYTSEKPLSVAPPRSILRMFGGPLGIEQYREYVAGTNDLISSELPPVRVMFPSMNVQGPLRDVKKYVSLSTDVIEKASESLRLKRSKPVHVNIPTLDMCMSK